MSQEKQTKTVNKMLVSHPTMIKLDQIWFTAFIVSILLLFMITFWGYTTIPSEALIDYQKGTTNRKILFLAPIATSFMFYKLRKGNLTQRKEDFENKFSFRGHLISALLICLFPIFAVFAQVVFINSLLESAAAL